jgi:hypothetical protein
MTSLTQDSQRSDQKLPEYHLEALPHELTCSVHQNMRLAVYGGDRLALRPGRFTPRDRAPDTHWIGGWVGPRVGLNSVEERKTCSRAGNRTPIPRSSSL